MIINHCGIKPLNLTMIQTSENKKRNNASWGSTSQFDQIILILSSTSPNLFIYPAPPPSVSRRFWPWANDAKPSGCFSINIICCGDRREAAMPHSAPITNRRTVKTVAWSSVRILSILRYKRVKSACFLLRAVLTSHGLRGCFHDLLHLLQATVSDEASHISTDWGIELH